MKGASAAYCPEHLEAWAYHTANHMRAWHSNMLPDNSNLFPYMESGCLKLQCSPAFCALWLMKAQVGLLLKLITSSVKSPDWAYLCVMVVDELLNAQTVEPISDDKDVVEVIFVIQMILGIVLSWLPNYQWTEHSICPLQTCNRTMKQEHVKEWNRLCSLLCKSILKEGCEKGWKMIMETIRTWHSITECYRERIQWDSAMKQGMKHVWWYYKTCNQGVLRSKTMKPYYSETLLWHMSDAITKLIKKW